MKRLLKTVLLLLSVSTLYGAGSFVVYEVDGDPYEGYMVKSSENAPLVVIVHDWDGLNDYEIRRAEMLNGLGYSVFAVDLFGKGVRPTALEDKRRLTGALYKDRKKMRILLEGGLKRAEASGLNVGNAVAVGYCFGGAAVLELARSGADLKAFVTFHGGLKTPRGEGYSKTKGKLLVLHGSADTSVTMEDFAALTRELEAAHIPHEMITYSGAPHAFSVFGTERYREDADRKSWRRFTEFLEESF